MKVAIVHDVIQNIGGAEKVMAVLAKIYRDADIYTLTADTMSVKNLKLKKTRIKTSVLNRLPLVRQKNSLIQMLSPLAWQSFQFNKYDLIISSSGFAMSNLVKTGITPHIIYVNSPPKNILSLSKKWSLQKIIPYHILLADKYERAIKGSSHLVANSVHIKKLYKSMFSVDSRVIYPSVEIPKKLPKLKSRKHFVSVGRLSPEKRVDLAIKACNQLKLPLKIVGDGPDLKRLKSLAGPSIEFLGFMTSDFFKKIFVHALAFIHCQKDEDFGMAPVEAMGYGIPVIAHKSGGLEETVIEGKTGLFFRKYTLKSLITVLKKFNPNDFSPVYLYNHAKKFSDDKFVKEFKKYVSKVLNQGYTDK